MKVQALGGFRKGEYCKEEDYDTRCLQDSKTLKGRGYVLAKLCGRSWLILRIIMRTQLLLACYVPGTMLGTLRTSF